jgi:general secretion pathway protein M
MIYRLPKRARQICAVMLVFLPVGLFALLVIDPLYAHLSGLRSQIEQERTLVGRLTAVAGSQASVSSTESLSKLESDIGLFLPGESEAIRLANLQSRLSEIVSGKGIKLRSARNLPSKERYDLHLLGVQLQFAAPVEQLQPILAAIEAQKPLLFVEGLQVTPLANSSEDEKGNLDTRFDVFGVGSARKNG